MPLEINSSAFEPGQPIPTRHTADGPDDSPPLGWSGAPEGTRSFTLICDDPDAPMGTWVHWVLYNLPPEVNELPEGIPTDPRLPDGSCQGKNDFGRFGYGGPSPPPGKPHRYFFKVYALDSMLELGPGATKADIEQEMSGHIMEEGELVSTYRR